MRCTLLSSSINCKSLPSPQTRNPEPERQSPREFARTAGNTTNRKRLLMPQNGVRVVLFTKKKLRTTKRKKFENKKRLRSHKREKRIARIISWPGPWAWENEPPIPPLASLPRNTRGNMGPNLPNQGIRSEPNPPPPPSSTCKIQNGHVFTERASAVAPSLIHLLI